MDRPFVYTGALPQTLDLLNTNRNTLYALGYALQAALGVGTSVIGLVAAQTTSPSMQITIGSGAIHALAEVDANAYGDLGTDANTVLKQGILKAPVTLTLTAPTTSGYSQVYLVEAAYEDVDGGAMVLPYYNSTPPYTPFAGPGGLGASNMTTRQGQCAITLKPGVALPSGSQVAPATDPGFVPLYTITLSNGQTSITTAQIVTASGAPFVPYNLNDLPTYFLKLIGGTMTGFLTLNADPTAALHAVTKQYLNNYAPTSTVISKITANLTLYISTTGSDTTGAGTISSPWATLQHAYNYCAANYNANGYQITFQLADGTYAGLAVNVPLAGSGPQTVVINGNATSPSNVLITTGANTLATAYAVNVTGFCLQNVAISAPVYGQCIQADQGATITITGPIVFGVATLGHIIATNGAHVIISSSYTISGSAQFHISATVSGVIASSNGPYLRTLVGALTFSTGFAVANVNGIINESGGSIPFGGSGSATGPRYSATTNSIISTAGGGVNYFPGSVAGATSTGGLYT